MRRRPALGISWEGEREGPQGIVGEGTSVLAVPGRGQLKRGPRTSVSGNGGAWAQVVEPAGARAVEAKAAAPVVDRGGRPAPRRRAESDTDEERRGTGAVGRDEDNEIDGDGDESSLDAAPLTGQARRAKAQPAWVKTAQPQPARRVPFKPVLRLPAAVTTAPAVTDAEVAPALMRRTTVRPGTAAGGDVRAAVEPLWLRNARLAQAATSAAPEAAAATDAKQQLGHMSLEEILTVLQDENAQRVCVIDLAGQATFAQHMVVLEGYSRRHLGAMADALVRKLKVRRIPEIDHAQVEGRDTDWMVVDAGTVVVHLFLPPVRRQYDLESLWTNMDLNQWLDRPTPTDDALLWVTLDPDTAL